MYLICKIISENWEAIYAIFLLFYYFSQAR